MKRKAGSQRGLGRAPSPILATVLPWVTIVVAILTPLLPIIPPVPLLPPLGFLFLVAWRLQRPGLLPIWAGFPLGLLDDLYSGQPFGSGIMLWSAAMIALEVIESRFPWRSFVQDWLTALLITGIYLVAASILSGATPSLFAIFLLGPQLVLSAIAFPLIARFVSGLDRARLAPVGGRA